MPRISKTRMTPGLRPSSISSGGHCRAADSLQEVLMRLRSISFVLIVVSVELVSAQSGSQRVANGQYDPPGTFSILGFDPETGEIGAAVQSRVFSVGNGVLWAEAGVGAVATQAIVDVSYGP